MTIVDNRGHHAKKRAFYVRLNNGTRSIEDEAKVEKYIVGRWGKP